MRRQPSSVASSARLHAWSWVVLGIAGVLFGYGMTADLPFSRLGIEQEHIQLALKCGTGDLNPHFFIHPPLLSYVLFVFYGAAYVIGRALGWIPSLAAFERLYFTDPTVFYLIARAFMWLMAMGSVVLFHRIARRLFDERTALIATALMAFAPELVRWAHYAVPTVFMLCLFMASVWCVVRIFQDGGGWREYLAAGFLGGLATAAKYDGALMLFPLLTAHILAPRGPQSRRWWQDPRLWGALACMGLAYALGAWYTIVDIRRFSRDWKFLYDTVAYGALTAPGSRITKPGWLFIFLDVLPFGWSMPLTVLGIAGVIHALIRRSRRDLLFLGMIGFILVYMSRWQLINSRYFVQVAPFMILLGVDWLMGVVRALRPSWWRGAVVTAIFAVLFAAPLAKSMAFLDRVAQLPPARQAKTWIEATLPAGTKIVTMADLPIVPNAVSIQRQLEEIERKQMGLGERLRRLLRHQSAFAATYDVIYLRFPSMGGYDPEDFDFAGQAQEGVRYFILDSSVDEYLAEPHNFPAQVRYIDQVRQHCRLLQEFRGPWVDVVPPMRAREEYMQIYELADRS